jgi:hypothetical protein
MMTLGLGNLIFLLKGFKRLNPPEMDLRKAAIL